MFKDSYKIKGHRVSVGCQLNKAVTIDALKDSYSVYYNYAERDDRFFYAEAVFDSKGEQYFLVKAAKIAETHSSEYVYFSDVAELDSDTLTTLVDKAWESGLSHVVPSSKHKNTDVVLYIVAESISAEALELLKKLK